MPLKLTTKLVAAHERLYPQYLAFLRTLERVAGRAPSSPLSQGTERLARELIAALRKSFGAEAPKLRVGHGLDHAALVVTIGQAVAFLELVETEHTDFDAKLHGIAWDIPGAAPRLVARLRPRDGKSVPTPADQRKKDAELNKVYRRLAHRENWQYQRGYDDALAGNLRDEVIRFGPLP